MHFFKKEIPGRIAYFEPVGGPPLADGLPRHVHLLKQAFDLPEDATRMSAMLEDQAFQMITRGSQTDFLDQVYAKVNEYSGSHDMVVIKGWRAGGTALNAQMAAHLDAPAILVVDYNKGDDAAALYDRAMSEVQEYKSQRAEVMGVIVNKVPELMRDQIHNQILSRMAGQDVPLVGTLPFSDTLAEIRLDEIYHQVDGQLLFSKLDQVHLDTSVREILVATPQAGNLLVQMHEMKRPLVITTPDRIDTVLTCVAVHMTGSIPVAGLMVACHDGTPTPYRPQLQSLFDNLERQMSQRSSLMYRLPVFITRKDVFEAVKAISEIVPAILPSSKAKIDAAINMFDDYVDSKFVAASVASHQEKLTPSKFLYTLRERCRASPQRIVLPESNDHRILSAASMATQKGLARITLLGHEETIMKEGAKLGLNMSGIEVIDPTDPELLDSLANDLVEARKSKGMNKASALGLLKDVNYVGTMLVRSGRLDGLVSGAVHTTAATVRPGMQVLKDKSMPLISSVFFMCLPDRVLVYGDCAVNVDPTAEQLAYIAIASAGTAAAFGIDPKVAMLSYSTQGSGAGPQVEKIVEATRIAQAKRPDLKIVGPMQYDAATNPRVAAVKVKNDPTGVAGNASVLIFPDLDAGNNTYKAVQQASGAIAMGPIIQGLSGAVNDLSRGCTVADILDTICATSLQAMSLKNK